jgi:EpsI family protein
MTFNLRFALAGCLLAGTGIFIHARHTRDVLPARQAFASFPHQIGDWTGEDVPISRDVLDVLGPGDFLSRRYRNSPPDADIDLFMAYFPSQRAGETIHSPRNCLPGSGWLPLESRRSMLSLPGFVPFPANRYIIAKGSDRRLVLYWYRAHNRSLANEYSVKFYLVADSLRFNRSDGSLIRITTPLASDETPDAGQQRLVAFAEYLLPHIDAYVPR